MPEAGLATLEFIDAAALLAMEVVVMSFPGEFVPRGLAGQLHHIEPALFDKAADIAVDGGNSEAVDVSLRLRKHLFWREWPAEDSNASRIAARCLVFRIMSDYCLRYYLTRRTKRISPSADDKLKSCGPDLAFACSCSR